MSAFDASMVGKVCWIQKSKNPSTTTSTGLSLNLGFEVVQVTTFDDGISLAVRHHPTKAFYG